MIVKKELRLVATEMKTNVMSIATLCQIIRIQLYRNVLMKHN